MDAYGFKVTLTDEHVPNSFFELRTSDTCRPMHLFVRRLTGAIGINTMFDGNWNVEEPVVTLPEGADIPDIYIRIRQERVVMNIGDITKEFTLFIPENQPTLHQVGTGMTWQSLPPEVAALPADINPAERALDALGTGQQLNSEGLGEDVEKLRLAQDSASTAQQHLRFLTANSVCDANGDVLVIDIDYGSDLCAIQARKLLTKARVLKLDPGPEAQATITKLIDLNDLGPIEFGDLKTIETEIAGAKGAVFIQGPDAFETLGTVIDALTPAQRDQLSIWSSSDDIIPGTRALPCKNIQLSCPPTWCLNKNAAVDVSGRRHGVDIAIAAYNAKDYLIECAESLLCEGRDDVRVIIVDDGSSDGSGQDAAQHFAKDARVRVEHKVNGGCASARNYGRLVSDATHITFVDADDFVTPNFFADLYDLSLYTGAEVTQGGFDFYDDTLDTPYYPSYEDKVLKDVARSTFKGQPLLHLRAADIIKGQPTIWRKVYRRDFLDAKDIYFPENIRAYDDYIFQMITLTEARDIYMLPEQLYHYRQHPAQDIKQGDERHFNMFFMFRMLLKRAVSEGWSNFRPYCESITDCIAWSSAILRPELVDSFLKASVQICVAVRRVYGTDAMSDDLIDKVKHPDFRLLFDEAMAQTQHIADGIHWAYFDGPTYTPEFIKSRKNLVRGY